ncbi:MAG: DUF4911 domain-containing protein [Bacillota bacterium]
MSMVEEDTHRITVKLPPEEIVFVDMVFKSYEGLARLSIDHDREGVITLDVTRGTHGDVVDILKDLQQQFPLKILKEE